MSPIELDNHVLWFVARRMCGMASKGHIATGQDEVGKVDEPVDQK